MKSGGGAWPSSSPPLTTHPITIAMTSGLAALSGTSMVTAENTLTT